MDSKEGVEALFLYATEGILVVNSEGVIIRANPSAEKLFGYDHEELMGQKVEILVPGRFADKHQQHRNKYNDNRFKYFLKIERFKSEIP
jgi:PAS domain S-box-containing protein